MNMRLEIYEMMKWSAASLAWRQESAFGRLVSKFCCRVATDPKCKTRGAFPSGNPEWIIEALLLDS